MNNSIHERQFTKRKVTIRLFLQEFLHVILEIPTHPQSARKAKRIQSQTIGKCSIITTLWGIWLVTVSIRNIVSA